MTHMTMTSSKNLKALSVIANPNGDQIDNNNTRKSFTDIRPAEIIDEMQLNNQAVYVKSLLSSFIENASPEDRKGVETNNVQPKACNEWGLGRSKTKTFLDYSISNNQSNNKKLSLIPQKNFLLDENNNEPPHDVLIKLSNDKTIKDNSAINQSHSSLSQSQPLSQLLNNDKIKYTSQLKNNIVYHNQSQQLNTKTISNNNKHQRRKTLQEKPQLNFSKLFQEKRQSHNNNRNYSHNEIISRNSRTSKDYLKKNTFSPMKNHLSFQSNHLPMPNQLQIPFFPNNNTNSNMIANHYNRLSHSMKTKNNSNKITEQRQSKDIRNVLPLDQSNYQAFNQLCSELKNNFINKNESPISNTKSDKDKLKVDTIKMDSCDEGSTFKNQSGNKTIHELRYRNYLKNKPVYDSLSDEESDEELSGYYYIEPNSYAKMVLDGFIIIASLYSILFTPYWLAFDIPIEVKQFSIRFFNEIIIDALFFIDLVIGFFVAYYDFEEQFISKLELMMKNYLMGWFIIDLITGFPFNSLFVISKSFLKYLTRFKLLELLILLRVIKLFKVCMYNSVSAYLIRICSEIDIIARWARLYFSLIVFFLSVYLLSCVFVFLGTLDYPNWIVDQGYEYKQQKADVLITSFYYICTTVFTIGYGDVVSVSTYERIFNLFLLVVGIMIYSWAVTALSNYVQNVDSKTMEYQKRMATLDIIRLSHEKLPVDLYEKISRFLSYKLHNEKRDKNDIIDNLPIGLRNKLIMEMYKSIIGNFIFFKSFNNTDFIIKVLLALKPIQALKNERLVKEGDYIEEIIFVKRGSLALEIPLPIQISDEIIQSVKTKQDDTFAKMGIPRKSIVIRPQNRDMIAFNETSLDNGNFLNKTSKTKTSHFLNYNKTSLFQKQDKRVNPIQTYVKIIEIRRNEHFGDILMFLNKRSPLSVKVKSKVVELLYLKKTDAVEISMSFPTFWRKIIKKSLFNMEQIERLMNKALKFFFIHNEGNDGSGPHNYYQKDIEKTNTFVNSNTLYDNPKFSDACELQSIPSIDNSCNNIIDDTGIILENDELDEDSNSNSNDNINSNRSSINKTNTEKDNDSLSQTSDYISNDSRYSREEVQESNSSNSDAKVKEKKTIIIKEEEEDDYDDEEEENKKRNRSEEEGSSHRSSSRQDTIKMVITNANVSFSSNSSKNSNNYLPTFSCTNNVTSNKKYKTKTLSSKETLILSQDVTMPFSKDEINNETYPYENSIDLKSNSNIPHLISREINPSSINMSPQEDLFNANNNKSPMINLDEETALFCDNNHIESRRSDCTKDELISPSCPNAKAITFKSTQTLKMPLQRIDLNTITQSASFSICNNSVSQNSKLISGANSKKEKEALTSTSISQFSSKKTEWKRTKSKWQTKDKERLTKSKSFQSLNTVESRRLSQLMMSITKHEYNNANKELIKSNRLNEGNGDSPIKRKKNEKKQSTLDVISQNIEKNMMNLINPKYFYSKYFSQVMNKTDVKDKNKQLKEKLNSIAKIIEDHHPKKSN